MPSKQLKRLGRSVGRLPGKIASYPFRYGWVGRQTTGARLGFCVDGGMGDHVVAARFIMDLVNHVGDPSVRVDVYCKKPALMSWLIGGMSHPHRVLEYHADFKYVQCRYHVFLNVVTFAEVLSSRLNGVLDPLLRERLDTIVGCVVAAGEPMEMMMRNHPLMDGYLGAYAALKGYRRHNFPHAMAGIPYRSDTMNLETPPAILASLGLSAGGYITISNGFDAEMAPGYTGPATKVYPYFDEVTRLLKQNLPELDVVQIGCSTSIPIPYADLNLIGKTSIQEAAGILQCARLHLDCEGGLVHLASAVGTRSCVLFGPTRADYFGYENNINIDPPECGGCWWMEKSWMTHCVRGYAQPACMYSRSPVDVAQAVKHALKQQTIQQQTISFRVA
jgi:hypothetical protein